MSSISLLLCSLFFLLFNLHASVLYCLYNYLLCLRFLLNISFLLHSSHHKEELTIFLKQNYIDILLISETHFTYKNYFRIPSYKLCHTTHPDGTAHGGTAILTKESIQHYELLKYQEESIQATSIKVRGFPY